jgi:hypothetical protein
MSNGGFNPYPSILLAADNKKPITGAPEMGSGWKP